MAVCLGHGNVVWSSLKELLSIVAGNKVFQILKQFAVFIASRRRGTFAPDTTRGIVLFYLYSHR